MKKRMLSIALMLSVSMSLAGCGNTQELPVIESQEIIQESVENNEVSEDTKEEEQQSTDINAEAQGDELTFEDLSKRRFDFSSGAGAWGEEFTIEKDGYFTGKYFDSNMGETGEGYPDGTFYSCSYSGHFTDLTKVGEYSYEMKLADISYKKEPGTEELVDGVKYIYTDAYFADASEVFHIYLPGMPVAEMSDELYMWIRDYNQSETELTMIVIADEKNELATASVERPAPYEEAKMTYDTYKESWEYYGDKLANEAQTTMDMRIYTWKIYELSDEYLNYLWNLIRYNVSAETYETLLEEQRVWIASKEEKANEIMEEYGGGTFAPVDVNDTLAQMTIKRCEELIEYLK